MLLLLLLLLEDDDEERRDEDGWDNGDDEVNTVESGVNGVV